jgi:hypothetical protein
MAITAAMAKTATIDGHMGFDRFVAMSGAIIPLTATAFFPVFPTMPLMAVPSMVAVSFMIMLVVSSSYVERFTKSTPSSKNTLHR